MDTNKLAETVRAHQRNIAQVLGLLRQLAQIYSPPINENILSASTSHDTENLRSPILDAGETKVKRQLHL